MRSSFIVSILALLVALLIQCGSAHPADSHEMLEKRDPPFNPPEDCFERCYRIFFKCLDQHSKKLSLDIKLASR